MPDGQNQPKGEKDANVSEQENSTVGKSTKKHWENPNVF
jgi:hypothetical protein